MSWNSYNAFMDNLGKGDHLAGTLIILALVAWVGVLAMRRL